MPFGYYFSYFVVLSRCVLAIVWLGSVGPNPLLDQFGALTEIVFKPRLEVNV